MSALCQKQTLRSAAETWLFDHLVGASLKRLRHRQAKCLGGFQIDDKLEFGCCLN
jgi:hypothetical protein